MQLSKIYASKPPVFSVEVFPPKSEAGIATLVAELKKMMVFDPAFISVTYGAGGMSQDRSLMTLERIVKEMGTSVVAHLTCIGSSPETISLFIRKIESWGIENILALRGDYPKNDPAYKPESDYFTHAEDLIKFAKRGSKLDIGVPGFPEKHPEAPSMESDLYYLKQKIDAGAAAVISQLFFRNVDFLRYRDAAAKAGVHVPIVPGIMPLLSASQIDKISECGATVPNELRARLESKVDDAGAMKAIGEEWAIRQIEGLLSAGVPGIHLYPLNKASSVTTILDAVGALPKA
jgi:methylenetetrahydrofolate reductase (NADPH)